MRLAVLFLIVVAVSISVEAQEAKSKSELGFRELLNPTLEGWQQEGNWKIRDGVVAREARGGPLVYVAQKVPDDFELRFEWKVAEGSNSGVYYRPTQYEYQILDNSKHADGKNPRTSAASLYFCMAPSEDVTRPIGEWNSGRIVCKRTVIQHWLNGKKVVGFDYEDPQWKEEVEMLRVRGGNLAARGAYLTLQDHGDPVWYRNICLRALGPHEVLDRTPVRPAEISKRVLDAEQQKLHKLIERQNERQTKVDS